MLNHMDTEGCVNNLGNRLVSRSKRDLNTPFKTGTFIYTQYVGVCTVHSYQKYIIVFVLYNKHYKINIFV